MEQQQPKKKNPIPFEVVPEGVSESNWFKRRIC